MDVYLYPDGFCVTVPEHVEMWNRERELDEPNVRLFVALFSYNPAVMSPNRETLDEELSFEAGEIIKDAQGDWAGLFEAGPWSVQLTSSSTRGFLIFQVYGDKDVDGFYQGQLGGHFGFVPSNMVSEIPVEDGELKRRLFEQGFLLEDFTENSAAPSESSSVPVDVAVHRMVALFDYDPWASSPNVNVQDELPFRAGDIIYVFGDVDDDGFYYGDLHGHRGHVPSNFLQRLPWD